MKTKKSTWAKHTKNAVDFLEHAKSEFPFSIHLTHVDGGSAFMQENVMLPLHKAMARLHMSCIATIAAHYDFK